MTNDAKQTVVPDNHEFVMIDIRLPEDANTHDNLVKVAGLLLHAVRQDIVIGSGPNPDGKNNYLFTLRFRSLNMPDLTSALLKGFSQFHLMWIDGLYEHPAVGIPVVGRFGESWTSEFSPLWFNDEHDGDRYYDGDTVLVWNKLGHEFLTGDTLFKAGTSEIAYQYGCPGVDGESVPQVTHDEITAALTLAAQPGHYLSIVLPAGETPSGCRNEAA
jgi:hypothetical protein